MNFGQCIAMNMALNHYNRNSCYDNPLYRIEQEKLNELKRTNSLLEEKLLLDKISKMSNERLLELMFNEVSYYQIIEARGGRGNIVLLRQKIKYSEPKKSEKYYIYEDEVLNRGLITKEKIKEKIQKIHDNLIVI